MLFKGVGNLKRIGYLMIAVMMMLTGCGDSVPQEMKDDYYSYINKDILKSEIPNDRRQWGYMDINEEEVYSDFLGYIYDLERGKKSYVNGNDDQKILDFYLCAVDMGKRNEDGIKDLLPYIERIENARNIDEYMMAIAYVYECTGGQSLFNWIYERDMADADKNILYLSKSDKISSEGFGTEERINAYKEYLGVIFELAGEDEPEGMAERVVKLQTELNANCEVTDDYNDLYNLYSYDEVCRLFNNCNFGEYLKYIGGDNIDKVVLFNPMQARYINTLLIDEKLPVLKEYAKAELYVKYSNLLTEEYIDATNEYNAVLAGSKDMADDRILAIKIMMDYLEAQLGRVYTNMHYDKEAVECMTDMTEEIIAQYEIMINSLEWMSEGTKENAVKKLGNIKIRIGSPEKYKTWCEEFDIVSPTDGGSMIKNIVNINRAEFKYNRDNNGKNVDNQIWRAMPYVTNCYYYFGENSINIPLAMLNESFYGKDAEYEFNLSRIGSIVGHEITHAFDKNNSMFDENGELNNWWEYEDYAKFDRLGAKISAQYSAVEVLENVLVSGKNTLSENIADLGALSVIVDIGEEKDLDMEKLFENYASVFGCAVNDEYTKFLIMYDSHSPSKVRANMTLSNCDEFYEVYGIDEDDGMYIPKEERVGIWK